MNVKHKHDCHLWSQLSFALKGIIGHGQVLQLHSLPVNCAKELFKPPKGSVSLPVRN